MAILAARQIERFGMTPKVALSSHSNFGSVPSSSARRVAQARELIAARESSLAGEGEMQDDAAPSETIRQAAYPASQFKGEANLLLMRCFSVGR